MSDLESDTSDLTRRFKVLSARLTWIERHLACDFHRYLAWSVGAIWRTGRGSQLPKSPARMAGVGCTRRMIV